MNTESTVETASAVEPNTSVSSRVHTCSNTSPEAPDRKKQASTRGPIFARTNLAVIGIARQKSRDDLFLPGNPAQPTRVHHEMALALRADLGMAAPTTFIQEADEPARRSASPRDQSEL